LATFILDPVLDPSAASSPTIAPFVLLPIAPPAA